MSINSLVKIHGDSIQEWPEPAKDRAMEYWLEFMSTASPNVFETKYEELQRIIIGLHKAFKDANDALESGKTEFLSGNFVQEVCNSTYGAIEQDLKIEIEGLKWLENATQLQK